MIRSYETQDTCIREFARCLDEHSRVYSVMLGMNRWSAMRIECVVAAFVGLLTFTILIMHRSKSVNLEQKTGVLFKQNLFSDIPISDLSLILAYSFTLVGSVQWIVRLTVDVMMQVG